MHLTEFNSLDAAAAASKVAAWAAIDSWVDSVVRLRPYRTLDDLAATAAELADEWTVADLDAALGHHPRIGQTPTGTSAQSVASRSEQAAVSTATAATSRAIALVNTEYENRFGRVFLIRAAGRTPDEILAHARRRLHSDDRTEAAEAIGQLREIALLRLRSDVIDAGTCGT